MDIKLMQLRKLAGYKNRDDFADEIAVNRYTYRSWETGAAMMSLKQAYDCAVALNCTIDEIAGLKHPAPSKDGPGQAALANYYTSMDPEGRAALVESARLMSRNPASTTR